jgi:ribosomal protein L37AE/L43A
MADVAADIKADFPQFRFKKAPRSRWDAHANVIYYTDNTIELLHELGHALLGHDAFTTDVDLLRKERAAWTKARTIAKKYNLKITDGEIEKNLDSYRQHLHRRSLCPKCYHNGVQSTENKIYQCIMCGHRWPTK